MVVRITTYQDENDMPAALLTLPWLLATMAPPHCLAVLWSGVETLMSTCTNAQIRIWIFNHCITSVFGRVVLHVKMVVLSSISQ